MKRFIAKRVLTGATTMFLVVTIVFVLGRAFSDPRLEYIQAQNPSGGVAEQASREYYESLGKQFGLDKPLIYQYGLYVASLVRGNLGNSLHQKRPVKSIILERLPATAKLTLGATLFSVIVGVPLGIVAAVRRDSLLDYVGRAFAILGHSVPSFWVALLLIYIFGVTLHLLPTSTSGGIKHLVMPSVTLGWASCSGLLRLIRSSMLESLGAEYVKLARAKGVTSWLIIWKHALRNALLSPFTYFGLMVAGLITGTVIIETVFAWPGLGLLAIQSVYTSDYPTLQGVFLIVASFYVVTTLLIDIVYSYVDPRIRYG